MTRRHLPLGLLLTALLLAGCGGDDGNDFVLIAPGPAPAPATLLVAIFGGELHMPRVDSAGHADGTVTIAGDRASVDFEVTFHGLGEITGIHVHLGAPGETGGHLFDLALGNVASPLSVTMTAADAMMHPGHGIATFEDALVALEEGRAYINIHTTDVPGGELRGQIGAVKLAAFLNGDQTVPLVDSSAGSFATLSFDGEMTELTIAIDPFNVPAPDAVHLHLGGLGETGPHLFTLHGLDWTQPSQVTVTEADLETSHSIATWHDAVRAILAGNSYLNVHTPANPSGEIRGQVGAQHIRGYVGGYQAVPLTISTGHGFVDLFVNGMQDQIAFSTSIHGLDDITAAHLHHGLPEQTGGHVFDFSNVPFGGELTGHFHHHDLVGVPADGINTFADALSAIFIGDTYVNVHTVGVPDGEIRGQMGIIRAGGELDGLHVVPPVLTTATGEASFFVNASQDRIDYEVTVEDLHNITGASAFLGIPGMATGEHVFTIADEQFHGTISGSFGNPSPTTGGGGGHEHGGGGGGGHTHPVVRHTHTFPDPGMPPPLGPIEEFGDLVNHIAAGFTTVVVETLGNPAGEVRANMHP